MKVFIILALAAVALADNPSYAPAPPSYPDVPPQYTYQYEVEDQKAALEFGANEARDGDATNGGYRVLLPDGRTQVVTYTVTDANSGYIVEVKYEGEAKEYQPPKQSYKPAPAPAYPPPTPAPAPVYPPPTTAAPAYPTTTTTTAAPPAPTYEAATPGPIYYKPLPGYNY